MAPKLRQDRFKAEGKAKGAEVAAGTYSKNKNNPIFTQALDEHLKKSAAENEASSYKKIY